MNCRDCGNKLLPFGQSLQRVFDVGYKRIKITCKDCAIKETEKLKRKIFVEDYNGEKSIIKMEFISLIGKQHMHLKL